MDIFEIWVLVRLNCSPFKNSIATKRRIITGGYVRQLLSAASGSASDAEKR
jgi:hypothetical protein